MKNILKVVVWCLSLAIVFSGVAVKTATNKCLCSVDGTDKLVDVTQLKGYIKIDTADLCKDWSANDGYLPTYYYCSWYESDIKKMSWKKGIEINVDKKNGCFCKKGAKENTMNSGYEGCSTFIANPSLGYDSCSWYENDILIKNFTTQNVGKCIAVYEGDYCGQFDEIDCKAMNSQSPCYFALGVCALREIAPVFCGKLAITDCKGYPGLCAWQGAGTDINKPIIDPKQPQIAPKAPSTFNAAVLNKLGTTDLKLYIGRIIKGVMGILGSLALVMFVYSGILFMTDRGNGENIGKAKDIAVWTTLGLVVIFASYAILNFVFQIFGK